MQKNKRDISVITGIYVQNEKNEIWFGRKAKWSDKLVIPGGHLDRGETLEEGAKRELLEEIGLSADSLEYIGHFEVIDPEEYSESKHFITFNYRYCVTGIPEITLSEQYSEGVWLTKEDALGRDDINALTRTALEALDSSEPSKEVNVDYKDKWLRAQADYSNLVKETAEKRSQWASMSEWQILEEFIPVYDNFKMAFRLQTSDFSPEQQKWVDGIGYIMKQFGDILKAHGIEEIETEGRAFDPNLHECMSEESSDEHEDGVIIREVSSGYKKGERVLKVAGVVVNKKN